MKIPVIEIHSQRQYGEPKLRKPRELKGVKRAFSTAWIEGKCTCPCYIEKHDVWIKHRDFNSIVLYERNTDNQHRQRFVYKDEWGAAVLRGEAWLKISDMILMVAAGTSHAPHLSPIGTSFTPYLSWISDISYKMASQLQGENVSAGYVYEWERFWDRVTDGILKYSAGV